MNVERIRRFLIKHPKPVRVRVTGEGEPQELEPGKSYARCAESIAALEGDLLELFGSKGELLRAIKLNGFEATRPESPPLPAGLSDDPQALLLTHFANLIARAYEHTTEVAFGKMVELVERMNDRAESIEERLERAEAQNRKMYNDQVDDAFERAEEVASKAGSEGGGIVDQLASAFLAGQMNAKPNGKGHPPGKAG